MTAAIADAPRMRFVRRRVRSRCFSSTNCSITLTPRIESRASWASRRARVSKVISNPLVQVNVEPGCHRRSSPRQMCLDRALGAAENLCRLLDRALVDVEQRQALCLPPGQASYLGPEGRGALVQRTDLDGGRRSVTRARASTILRRTTDVAMLAQTRLTQAAGKSIAPTSSHRLYAASMASWAMSSA